MDSTLLWFFIARLCTGFESSFPEEERFCCNQQSHHLLLERCDVLILFQEKWQQLPLWMEPRVLEYLICWNVGGKNMRFVFETSGQASPNLPCSFGCRRLHEKGCTVSADRRAFNKSAHYFFFILSASPIKAPATYRSYKYYLKSVTSSWNFLNDPHTSSDSDRLSKSKIYSTC